MIFQIIFLIFVSYLLGSIPVGYIIVKKKTGKDIRAIGSGSSGATNMARECGWFWGVITIFCDFGKGFFACLIAVHFFGFSCVVGMTGLSVVIGHIFPIFIPFPRFKGGKGMATASGVFVFLLINTAILYPQSLLIIIPFALVACWLIMLKIIRIMSLANIFLIVAITIYFLFFGFFTNINCLSPFLLIIACLVVWAHHENIKRLWYGTERKINWKK